MISSNNIAMMGMKTGLLLLTVMATGFAVSLPVNATTGYATAADLKPIRSNLLIVTRQHFCLTVKKVRANKVSNVQFLPCHGRFNQRWTLSKGGYLIHFGKRLRQCLSVPENLLRKGTALRLSDCRNIAGQRWFHKKGRLYLFLPKKGLCVTSRPALLNRRGSIAVLGPCLGKKGLALKLKTKMPLPLKPVRLRLKMSALCIDKTNGLKNGIDIKMTPCRHQDVRQRFKLEKKRGEDIQVQSTHSGKCLSVENASKKPGVRIQQWSCLGHDHQLWKKIDYPQGWFALQAKHSGLCLTQFRRKAGKTAGLIQNACSKKRAFRQLFRMNEGPGT
jgi:hypothetical protein